MIRVIALAAFMLTGCAHMLPPLCPEQMVTALICPPPLGGGAPDDFRAALAEEIDSIPPETALAKAAQAYLAVAKRCGAT